MRFLVDAQLPARLANWLCESDHDAIHTSALPRGNRTTDHQICAIADQQERVVVTKDADFVASHELNDSPASLLLVSVGNTSNQELLRLWAKHIDAIVAAMNESSFVELTASKIILRG